MTEYEELDEDPNYLNYKAYNKAFGITDPRVHKEYISDRSASFLAQQMLNDIDNILSAAPLFTEESQKGSYARVQLINTYNHIAHLKYLLHDQPEEDESSRHLRITHFRREAEESEGA